MKITLTSKEIKLLKSVIDSEYQDGEVIDNPIWMDYVVNTKSHGGVLASLKKKGLVNFTLVAKEDSNNWRDGRITDSTISITAKGYLAFVGAR
jgi:hypothetical protein